MQYAGKPSQEIKSFSTQYTTLFLNLKIICFAFVSFVFLMNIKYSSKLNFRGKAKMNTLTIQCIAFLSWPIVWCHFLGKENVYKKRRL